MATAACRTLALAGERGPAAQLLVYPIADLTDGDRPSRREAADTPPLTATALDWFVAQETTDDAQRRDPRCHRVLGGADLALTQAALFLRAAFEGAEPAAQ